MITRVMEAAQQIRRNIFLSDDDNDDCSLFLDALSEVRCEANVTIAHDGVLLMDALKKVVSDKPELIFLDLNMPRKNGFECLDEIRNSPKLKDIPVIIYSTSNSLDIVERVFKQGANLYITKPASYPLLKKTLAFVMSLAPDQLTHRPSRDQFVLSLA